MNRRNIMRVLPTLLIAASFTCCVIVQAEKNQVWQTGTLLDEERQNISDSVYENYEIDAGSMVYSSRELLKWRWNHEANLTVNGTVRFSVNKKKLYIIDADGKIHETEIMKKTLKTAQ
jgi:hypothetical protein